MDKAQLERECRSYTRYLTGQAATPYVIQKYRDFHQKMGAQAAPDRFGRFLESVSARGPLWARLADSYGTLWRKNSTVRRKLVVTLALLESSPPAFEYLDRCPKGGPAGAVWHLAWNAAGYGCALAAASALFAPVHLWMTVRSR